MAIPLRQGEIFLILIFDVLYFFVLSLLLVVSCCEYLAFICLHLLFFFPGKLMFLVGYFY